MQVQSIQERRKRLDRTPRNLSSGDLRGGGWRDEAAPTTRRCIEPSTCRRCNVVVVSRRRSDGRGAARPARRRQRRRRGGEEGGDRTRTTHIESTLDSCPLSSLSSPAGCEWSPAVWLSSSQTPSTPLTVRGGRSAAARAQSPVAAPALPRRCRRSTKAPHPQPAAHLRRR